MSRFVSQGTIRLDLGKGEWIDYREKLSYAELEPVLVGLDAKNEQANVKMAIPLLELAITNWCLREDAEVGVEIPFDKAKIKDLDTQTVLQIFGEIIGQYFPETQKKNLAN